MKNIVFIGPPGAGKGTQSSNMVKEYGVVQISTGDILRAAMRDGTELGLKARSFVESGQLVPDGLIVNVMSERLEKPDCKDGYILDGFPRTLVQAQALDMMLKEELGSELTHVLNLVVDSESLVSRITGRRGCPQCGRAYHVVSNKPVKEGVCDADGAALEIREDDKEEVLIKRLNAYERNTKPLISYYGKAGLLHNVDGNKEFSEVFEDIKSILSK